MRKILNQWPRSSDRGTGILTRQDLEDGSEEETSALDHLEQLIQKGNEGEEAEEYRQDHEGLDCLDPIWKTHRRREFRHMKTKHII